MYSIFKVQYKEGMQKSSLLMKDKM